MKNDKLSSLIKEGLNTDDLIPEEIFDGPELKTSALGRIVLEPIAPHKPAPLTPRQY